MMQTLQMMNDIEKVRKYLLSLRMADIKFGVSGELPETRATIHISNIIVDPKYENMAKIFGLETIDNVVQFQHNCKAKFYSRPTVVIQNWDIHVGYSTIHIDEFKESYKDYKFEKLWDGLYNKELDITAFINKNIVKMYEKVDIKCWE